MKKQTKNNIRQGFTLVELMTAIIILGILISIAIPNYARSTERAKGAQAVQILKGLRSAALVYFNEIDFATGAQNTFTGITIAQLELLVGANFDSIGNNPDWAFSIPVSTATRLQLQATRLGGPWVSLGRSTITLTDDVTNNTREQWSDPSTGYPWDNPGSW